ncbi:orotidine-5'-phosphate decarboxylase [Seinonella peptonophila]|uniref:Orotidine 5'-phosphate decarboxylase n=1 Tax=Seinonella peptonophila TaxID=112248 RepID=A0A1M4UXV3_9BACL|nr:orotidine-5'-phosphate decarboxylase [Seinonella peptonophila]SHE61463.1 orotidine-5'-phosphate decarboxylase [Seinonella peptonophila]
MNRPPVIIALDFPDAASCEALLAQWNEQAKPWIKVGYQLFYAVGPAWVAQKKEEGYSIFLDLKLHDIPNTVAQGVKSLERLGVDILTLHASGGSKMLEAALEARTSERLKLIAVTQLTSTDQQMLNHELGIKSSVEDSVLQLASIARSSKIDGVVCSGQEVTRIKNEIEPPFLTVVPGIRPKGHDTHDQKRIVTPTDAIHNGADYLVVGRPISKARSPRQVYEQIVQEVQEVKESQI